MRITFFTLGCKVNQYETACLEELFSKNGFTLTPAELPADVYVVNSCTVTAQGDKKTRQLLSKLRRNHPDALLALCGCMPQAFPEVADSLPDLQVITGARNRSDLLRHVQHALKTGQRVVEICPHETKQGQSFESLPPPAHAEKTRAFLKIQDGCDRHCAYCIIPKARGIPRSKPLPEIQQAATALADSGHREILLSGISLASYGKDCDLRLLDAIEAVCSVPNVEWVRLGSLDPDLLSEADVTRLSALDKVCPQFHLSLQSGCDDTLRRMRRRYTAADYQHLVTHLRQAFPHCAITSDVMVGFPGETDEEFHQTLAFVEKIGFANLHIFAYSRRAGTVAATLPDQVPEAVKRQRSALLKQVATDARRDYHASWIGKEVPVLFERSADPLRAVGHTPQFVPVVLTGDNLPAPRTIYAVTIKSADADACYAYR